MAYKNNPSSSTTGSNYPKFSESVVEIMDIIKYKGGLNQVIKESQERRKFTEKKITFSEIDGKTQKGKKVIAE